MAEHLASLPLANTQGSSSTLVIPEESWLTAGDLEIYGGIEGSDWNVADSVLHITSSKPLFVRNSTGVPVSATTIQIDPGVEADLTLAGVNIASPDRSPINMITNVYDIDANDGKGDPDRRKASSADEIRHKTKLYLTLADGTTNTLTYTSTGTNGDPAIRCGWGSVLVIDDELRNLD